MMILGLPIDVWAMMLFSILVFFGVSLWALVYSLREEERKMVILEDEGALDAFSPRALDDLYQWIQSHPNPSASEVEEARASYRDCVDTLRSTTRHFYEWSDVDIDELEAI